MIAPSLILKPLAIAAIVLAGTSVHAAIQVFTNAADFAAATSAPGVDTFTGLSITGSTPSPLNRTAGAYSYSATTSDSSFYGAGTSANPWLSTNQAADSITFNGFAPAVSAIGGNFFTSNVAGSFATGDITLTATDSLGATSTQTILGSTVNSFRGFVSDGNISSLTVAAVQVNPIWPTVDNLTLAVAVPEPSTYAMLLAGLASLGFLARRRRGA